MSLPTLSFTPNEIHPCEEVKAVVNREELLQLIWDHVQGDCSAVTVNGEIMYNSYEERDFDNSFRDRCCTQDFVTTTFVKGAHTQMVIYMYGDDTVGVVINFDGKDMNKYNVHLSYRDQDTYKFSTEVAPINIARLRRLQSLRSWKK